MKPDPSDATGGANPFVPAQAYPCRRRKSRKNSSSGEPGPGACASAAPLAVPASAGLGGRDVDDHPDQLCGELERRLRKMASFAGGSGSASSPCRDQQQQSTIAARITPRRPEKLHETCLPRADRRTPAHREERSSAGVSAALDMKWRRAWQDGSSDVTSANQSAAGEILRALFDAALAAADPRQAMIGRIPAPVRGRTVVVGAGKAAAAMAHAFESAVVRVRSKVSF